MDNISLSNKNPKKIINKKKITRKNNHTIYLDNSKSKNKNDINLENKSNIKNNELLIKNNKIILLDEIKQNKKQLNGNITKNITIPWIEKYRPTSIEDLAICTSTYEKIKKIINDKEMPNIIITGIPGIGKTTTILCIAKALLGKYYNQGVLELNASDDRGIKAVQDLIIYFCKKKMTINNNCETDNSNFKYTNHKIILLDEADNMTKKAQQLVNNLMETYHKTTRFAFTCNNSSEIIEAIQSRCIIFRYRRLSNESIIKRLKFICNLENVKYSDKGIDAIVTTSQGDMRQAINNLQLTFNGYKYISEKNVYKLCDKPHPIIIKKLFLACKNKNIEDALTFLEDLRQQGYSSSDISISMKNTLKSPSIKWLDEETKIKYMIEIGNTALKISKGIDTKLQLSGCISKMCYL